ncbi:response regulator transcription factor [Thalassomonas viridans]|uniref:Response regulator transcription factor n=1 Tax=Thalassomonas viridans TaxID=137584 RepID=A0AAF0CBQ8_9GAMM|nr:response regulator transcription factor [Thalassomonas viridans]WDE06809.1 response regulator transcription factor [Thalassomonas viridans]
MRLLLVEDDLALQANLQEQLVRAGYSVDVAGDGEEGLFKGREYPYDAAIIDVGLPKMDGISLIKTLRKLELSYPVIVLTARNHWQDKVSGLDAGADDYLTKPFQSEELLARLNALIRRSVGQASPLIENGPLRLNTSSAQVWVNEQQITLTSYEYKLLEYLALHPEQVKSKTELTEHIYDQDFDLDSNVIEVFVRRLRKKLDPDGEYGFIETLRGQGYKLKVFDAK